MFEHDKNEIGDLSDKGKERKTKWHKSKNIIFKPNNIQTKILFQ